MSESPLPAQINPKRSWTLPAILVFCLVALSLLAFALTKIVEARESRARLLTHSDIMGNPVLAANAKELKGTNVTPHLEVPIERGRNVLWCSTFQLVWNESCKQAGGDIHFPVDPPEVAVLNKKTAKISDVDAASCLVMSGKFEDGIVNDIMKELDRKFAGQADPELLRSVEGMTRGFLAYAYLFRALPFEKPFARLTEPLKFEDGVEIANFGMREMDTSMDEMDRAEQVIVQDYRGPDDFIVEVKTQEPNERILLAKIAPGKTLEETISSVHARCKKDVPSWEDMLQPQESFVVPILNFKVFRSYDELCGQKITTPGPLEEMQVVLCIQDIRFCLNEGGAILKSEAEMAAAESMGPQEPRKMIFDKPFLLLLERHGSKTPYYALWVGNSELLVPFEK